MGYIFDVDDETVWSPSLRVGQLYVNLAEAIARTLEISTGLEAVAEDMYDIDTSVFGDFTRALVQDFFSTRHVVAQEMLRGVLLASLVMLQRGGVEITPEGEEQKSFWSALPEFAQRMPM
ncbi:DUF6086 family protein [Actinomadura sp. K4S16]|uniref:DUF6086 family protein n=1 Tax=Actinomadura sp. K4S16 TaxID=1316147 RepID=UPI0011ED35E1|nr:DUF6086 family protein [Actinomadura sp. K4S16]